MYEVIPTRDQAWDLFCVYNKTNRTRKHALAVEAVMRYMAQKHNSDIEKWGVIGLVHDLDFEQFPLEHCQKTQAILDQHNWPKEYIRAALSHGFELCTDIRPETHLEKSLYAIDELTGLVTATVLVRPSKSILDLTPKSVKKKWKDRAFAAGVDRSVIAKGAEMLGVELGELIQDVIQGMRACADTLGLKGNINAD